VPFGDGKAELTRVGDVFELERELERRRVQSLVGDASDSLRDCSRT
jgi:hypothetical protein